MIEIILVIIGVTLALFLLYAIPVLFGVGVMLSGKAVSNKLKKVGEKMDANKIKREEQAEIKCLEFFNRQQEILEQNKKRRTEEMDKYRNLRREVEAMPQYQIWRQAVLQKFGRKCAVCGSTENLEVDHRYKSFYFIIKEHGIANIIQAYGCAELWDVNNGAPLCKTHHDQTPSSRKYLQNNQTIK